MATTYGTAYFVSVEAAIRYYEPQYDAATVRDMIHRVVIHIGKPSLQDGDTLSVIDGGTRYAITTQS